MQRTIPGVRFDAAPKMRFIPTPCQHSSLGCAPSPQEQQLRRCVAGRVSDFSAGPCGAALQTSVWIVLNRILSFWHCAE